MSDARRDFLIEVAWLHHEFDLTQEAIAARFGVSRSTVSRALADAERLGIVRVVVTVPMPREAQLAADLQGRLAVTATVGARVGDETSTAAVARAAARLLERIVAQGNLTIAASWGRTLGATAGLVRPRRTSGVTVVDAVGHAGGDRMVSAVEVTRTLASVLGATVVHLPSPAFVDSAASRESLMASPPVDAALRAGRHADVTLVSIGVAGDDSLLLREGLVAPALVADLAGQGAVGEILGRWFDARGRALGDAGPWAVGLSLDDLRDARRTIAVAGGRRKAPSLLAALAGGIVREIVVDDELAKALLEAAPSPT